MEPRDSGARDRSTAGILVALVIVLAIVVVAAFAFSQGRDGTDGGTPQPTQATPVLEVTAGVE